MRYGIIAALFLCLCGSAQAHTRHHRHHYAPIVRAYAVQETHADDWGHGFFGWVAAAEQTATRAVSGATEIVGHPAGCPRIAFCGCGVADRVFGRPVRDLWLAANWLRFPHKATAAPGMVAVFGRHHVAYIEAVNGDGTAVVYDPNSGGHLTRVHNVSIVRATIVDPHGA